MGVGDTSVIVPSFVGSAESTIERMRLFSDQDRSKQTSTITN